MLLLGDEWDQVEMSSVAKRSRAVISRFSPIERQPYIALRVARFISRIVFFISNTNTRRPPLRCILSSSIAIMAQDQPTVDTSSVGNETKPAQTVAEGKGKGKAADIAPQDVSMGEEDSSSDEETGAEDEVCALHLSCFSP
jgi:hypothetical protein